MMPERSEIELKKYIFHLSTFCEKEVHIRPTHTAATVLSEQRVTHAGVCQILFSPIEHVELELECLRSEVLSSVDCRHWSVSVSVNWSLIV